MRIWNRTPFPIRILECESCGLAFADSRFDGDEEQRLYADYRGKEYQSLRESYEPWYTPAFNARISTGTMEKRRAPLAEILRQHLPADVKTILDFGGDHGELFASLIPGAATSVYDISGVAAATGVSALHSLDECAKQSFDLIGCSNVLEHVASPKDVLADIRRIASPDTLVFVEVPIETPLGLQSFAKRAVQELVLLLTRPRVGVSMLPLHFLSQVHEHINFFSISSLNKLMQVSGFEVLATGVYPSEGIAFGPYRFAVGNLVWSIGCCSVQA